MLGHLLKIFRSYRFTIFIITVILLILFLGTIIPQKRLIGIENYIQWKRDNPFLVSILDKLDLTDIYTSPLMLFLWLVFFLHLLYMMSKRIRIIWRRVRGVLPSGLLTHRDLFTVDVTIHALSSRLHKRGYRIYGNNDSFVAIKNRLSPLATIIFHLSFLIILFGGVVSFYTNFKGFVSLAKGEEFDGKFEMVKMPYIGSLPSISFTIKDIHPVYYRKEIPIRLDVTILSDGIEYHAGINKPFKKEGLSFVIKELDVAPLFVIKDKKGDEIDGAYVKIKAIGGKEDFFDMAGYRFVTRFIPDYRSLLDERIREDLPVVMRIPDAQKMNNMAQKKEIKDPAVVIKVLKDKKIIKIGMLRLGKSIEFDDYRLFFMDIRYWLRFYCTSDKGIVFVYIGFIIAIAGLILRFLFPRIEIYFFEKDGRTYISGISEFYREIYRRELVKTGILDESVT